MHVRSDPICLANLRGTYDDLNVFLKDEITNNDGKRRKWKEKRIFYDIKRGKTWEIHYHEIYEMIEILIFTLTGWNETTEYSNWWHKYQATAPY